MVGRIFIISGINNNHLAIEFGKNGDIKSLAIDNGRNILAQNGMCIWLKHGTITDMLSGVFSNFLEPFHSDDYKCKKESENSIMFFRQAAGLRLRKEIILSGYELKINIEVENVSDSPIHNLQLEFFNAFSVPAPDKRELDYSILYPDKNQEKVVVIKSECFGQRFVKSFPCGSASQLFGCSDKNFHFKIESEGKCEAVTAMIFGHIFMRGFNSSKFSLNPRAKYRCVLDFSVEKGSIKKFFPKSSRL